MANRRQDTEAQRGLTHSDPYSQQVATGLQGFSLSQHPPSHTFFGVALKIRTCQMWGGEKGQAMEKAPELVLDVSSVPVGNGVERPCAPASRATGSAGCGVSG